MTSLDSWENGSVTSDSNALPTVGVVGGGQLARMMYEAALPLGISVLVLAEESGMSADVASVASGDYRDVETLVRFARGVDVLTFDHEHVPHPVLTELVAQGIHVQPGPDALKFAQDKAAMRRRLEDIGSPVPDWEVVETQADLEKFLAEHGGEAVVKTAMGGYDGKGVRLVTSATQVEDWLSAGVELLAEEKVSFRRELAQLVARRPGGEVAVWPVVQTVQEGGVCVEVIAPAPHSTGRVADVAADIAISIAEHLGVVGVMAVELFETTDERLLVNELAMRPHNSGHWTQDGSVTSQFEQHIRAVLDLPLGDTSMIAPWAVMANLLGGTSEHQLTKRFKSTMQEYPSVKIHLYGKATKPGRKLGHVNVIGAELDDLVTQARGAAAMLVD